MSFRTITGGLFCSGRPVVVDELHSDQEVVAATLEGFVIDSSLRWTWMHPNAVRTFGSYAERFDPSGRPFLALGAVADDLESADSTVKSLRHVLHTEGRRFSLVEVLAIGEQMLEVGQYLLMEAGSVPPDVLTCWMTFAPSRIFVRSDATTEGAVRVWFKPPFCVSGGPVNRHSPPAARGAPLSYAVCQLLAVLLTGVHPFGDDASQAMIKAALLNEGSSVPPVDFSRMLVPPEFKSLIQGVLDQGKFGATKDLQREFFKLESCARRFSAMSTFVPPTDYLVPSEYGTA
jgi:hypothetical protein